MELFCHLQAPDPVLLPRQRRVPDVGPFHAHADHLHLVGFRRLFRQEIHCLAPGPEVRHRVEVRLHVSGKNELYEHGAESLAGFSSDVGGLLLVVDELVLAEDPVAGGLLAVFSSLLHCQYIVIMYSSIIL